MDPIIAFSASRSWKFCNTQREQRSYPLFPPISNANNHLSAQKITVYQIVLTRRSESRSINETQLRNHDNFVLVPSTEERWNNHLQSFLNLNEWIVELFLCSSNAEIRG